MIPESYLLRITDKYPLAVPIKGSMTTARWTCVVVTSNFLPHDMYTDVGGRLHRRIRHLIQAESAEELTLKMQWLVHCFFERAEQREAELALNVTCPVCFRS